MGYSFVRRLLRFVSFVLLCDHTTPYATFTDMRPTMPAQLGLLVLFAGNVFAAAPCQGYTGVVSGGDCKKQWCPHPLNEKAYPKWHYCKRVPDDPDTRYSYLWQTLAPADVPYHKCSAGKVLRHDASGLICADYTQSDFHAGVCTDRTCCTGGVCSDYTCPAEWTKRATADSISCFFGCDDELCCDPPADKPVPREHAQGMLFVDKDPGRFVFGGNVTILRAIDESDITHYRVYWGFAQVLRKVPSCGLKNPVSWHNEKVRDPTKMLGEFKKTGCDITFEIPMGTKATDYERCPITWDRSNRNTAATDGCNPHYLMVVSVNENGEKPVTRENIQQLGPRHPISDYEAELGLTCAESGITGGHDLPGENDVVLGKWNNCPSAAECAKRCREYDGSKGACRQWTWAYNNGGSTSKTCWMESQTLTKTHYGVRVQGPAVCPTTSESNAPTGRERPRCTRWQRFQNKVPWTNPGNYNPWLYHKNGNNYVQRPTDPDVPLGTYQHAEYCKGLCDLDVLCTGFVFQKRLQLNSGTFKLLKKCVLMREDTFQRNTPTDGHEYDTWVCSREGMAPLVNGYTFEVNRFGYVTCGAATASSQTVMDSVDCCASACDADVGCVAFTFWNKEKRCDLFSSCASTAKVDKVEGCAFESCFDGFGASTYKKIAVRTIEVVDRWPRVGSKDGIPVRLQTNGMMDGAEVVCGVVHIAERNEIPKTAEDMKADTSLAGVVVSAIVENDVASLELKREKAGALMDGVKYTLRCAVVGASQYGLPAYFDTAIQLQEPRGYHFLRHGRCTSHKSCTTKTHEKGRGHTLDKCKALCEAQTDCRGFSYGANDGWCRWFSGCNLLAARPALHVYCFKREAAWDKLNDPKGECADTCSATDTCNFKRELGVYDRNVFTPKRQVCVPPTVAPTTAPATMNPTSVPSTPTPTDAPKVSPPTPAPQGTLDECSPNPCGADQECRDMNTGVNSKNDFECKCTKDPSTVATGAPAECEVDECAAKPCGDDQRCVDTDVRRSAQYDYECICTADASVKRTAAQPTCVNDECAGANPCDPGQSCVDPNTSPHTVKDFECTCDSDPATHATGTSATCELDECVPNPCGADQVCSDPNIKYSSRLDFVCTCTGDMNIKKVGGQPTCVKDECSTDPCGPGQSCKDPNTSPEHVNDFACTCDDDARVTAQGMPATCTVDECASQPCGADQTCEDKDTRVNAQFDYTCTCDKDTTTVRVGGAAVCVVDECTTTPCGADQTCTDTNDAASKTGDFECACTVGTMAKQVGAVAVCEQGSVDECATGTPCGSGQTCVDPATVAGKLMDYVCTCTVGTGSATGAPASCAVDECVGDPCGGGQDCKDKNTQAGSTGDFECSCRAPATGLQTGAPASCETDECLSSPCAMTQMCTEGLTTVLLDFTCTCTNGVTATGGDATCELDECASTPCGDGQTCNDPDQRSSMQHDFICTCANDTARTQQDGPALCYLDECASNPCGDQMCEDRNTSIESLKSFFCICTNGVEARGGVAQCEVDECSSNNTNPCGAGQLCEDKNQTYTSQHDFTCTCANDTTRTQTDGPALCYLDECANTDNNPCGDQACNDPDTSVGTLNDFVCTCTDGSTATGRTAVCVPEACRGSPCGDGQSCSADGSAFLCTCSNGRAAAGERANCELGAADSSSADSEDDDSFPWWVWLIIALGAVLLLACCGAAAFAMKRPSNGLSVQELIETQGEVMEGSIYHSPHDPNLVQYSL